jgi:hypothetical protein
MITPLLNTEYIMIHTSQDALYVARNRLGKELVEELLRGDLEIISFKYY